MRKAFTFLELIFVIVIMGILANFGTNILVTTYSAYNTSTVNNRLLGDTQLALKQISNRLQYRIKASVISRPALNAVAFNTVQSAGANDSVLEWVGYDIDGWLGAPGTTLPTWSGFIDVDAIDTSIPLGPIVYIESPGSDTGSIAATIAALQNGSGGLPAIFFTGANSNALTDYGYNGVALAVQSTSAAHPVTTVPPAPVTQLFSPIGAFTGTDIYENYKLAWSAYAISLEDFDGDGRVYPPNHPEAGQVVLDLVLYYDYQPWNGGQATAGLRRQLLLQNVDTFKYVAVGDTLQIQLCSNDLDAMGAGDGGYSVCEEIAIF